MKLLLPTLALAFAASVTAQYDNQSAPFHLVLSSKDKSIDGDTLSACHAGAAIEVLCLSHGKSVSSPNPIAPGIFYFNTSEYMSAPDDKPSAGKPGIINWTLQASDFNVSSGLSLQFYATTNVAVPFLAPGQDGSTPMAFDSNNKLNIQTYVDDRCVPATVGPTKVFYNWYACETYWSGYQYVTLNWVVGVGKPQNPSCVAVKVKRVFI
ncbi:hypothetical protein P154DRAFT_524223 [Amniculicola lignicola CBS 123094]|uniref:DUF7907 domain-containing protein n=1 Tax=Amniculicola lignicola CBS 123094 TaxID=1392246 RepID=A0A6A5W8S7_9PLEO|nr:hypothetical protein P154DRAFT_524223 [Amniculicola lignicola CBS 123094]